MKQHEVEKQMKQRVCFEMQSCQKQSHVICCTDCKVRLNIFSKDSDYQNQDIWLVKACKRRGKPWKAYYFQILTCTCICVQKIDIFAKHKNIWMISLIKKFKNKHTCITKSCETSQRAHSVFFPFNSVS